MGPIISSKKPSPNKVKLSAASPSSSSKKGDDRLPKSPWSPSAGKQQGKGATKGPRSKTAGKGSVMLKKAMAKKKKVSPSKEDVIKAPKKPRSAYVLYSLAFRNVVKPQLNAGEGVC